MRKARPVATAQLFAKISAIDYKLGYGGKLEFGGKCTFDQPKEKWISTFMGTTPNYQSLKLELSLGEQDLALNWSHTQKVSFIDWIAFYKREL